MKLSQPIWPQSLSTPAVLAWATLGPLGRRLPAPGTWGSVAGVLYFVVVFVDRLGPVGTVLFAALGLYLAVAFCGEAELRMGQRDPGEVVLDEFMAIPLCFIGWERLAAPMGGWPPWVVLLAGFGLFRLFDIWKPLGIRKLQDLPGGWGVVLDDVAAALVSCVVLHAGYTAWMRWE